MRYFAITLLGIYQLGRSSHTKEGAGGITLQSPPANWHLRTNTRGRHALVSIPEGGAAPLPEQVDDPAEINAFMADVAKQDNMLKMKMAMQHLDIPREYIEACFLAMGLEKERVSHLLSIAGFAPIQEIAEKLSLEEKFGKIRSDFGRNDEFIPCFDAMQEQYAHDEFMAESHRQAKRLALKQQMEVLRIPTEYIRACFMAIMGKDDAEHLMTIPEYATNSGEAKLTFEENLAALRSHGIDDEFVKCFDVMESNHKAVIAKASATINRVVQRYIADKKIRADRERSSLDALHKAEAAAPSIQIDWENLRIFMIKSRKAADYLPPVAPAYYDAMWKKIIAEIKRSRAGRLELLKSVAIDGFVGPRPIEQLISEYDERILIDLVEQLSLMDEDAAYLMQLASK